MKNTTPRKSKKHLCFQAVRSFSRPQVTHTNRRRPFFVDFNFEIASKEIRRIDKPEPTVPKSQWHAHTTKKKGGGALNQDGTIHDRDPQFSKRTLEWLKSYGWEI